MANSVVYNTTTKQLEINIDQGSTFEHTFTFTNGGLPYDLSNYDARLMVRKTYGASTPVYSGTIANGKLVYVNASIGQLKIIFTPSDTTDIKFASADDSTLDCVFDLEIQHSISGKVHKPASGTIVLNREVTR